MAGLQDLLEAYKNYRGVQDWKLGQQMNRVPGAEEAMDLWGGWDTGVLAGAIKAYHGSPRPEPFTHFSSEFMGSGEGAQAFGKGHYLAERPGIAKGYAEMRGPMFEKQPDLSMFSDQAKQYILNAIGNTDFKNPINKLKKDLQRAKWDVDTYAGHVARTKELIKENPNNSELLQSLLGWEKGLAESSGRLGQLQSIDPKQLEKQISSAEIKGPLRSLYEVSLEWPGARESVDPMSREHFFQWDKQFSSQPKHVKDALFDIIEQHPEIADPYAEWLAKHNVPGHTTHSLLTLQPQATIKAMQGAIEPLMYERGIPGVAFLDQPSRTKKGIDRTYNYVAFGDEIPRIISHNKPSVLDMLWPKK